MKTSPFLIAMSLCAAGAAHALTRYVALSGTHVAPFTTWTTAATNIEAAVRASAGGDTVLVTNGIYHPAVRIAVTVAVSVCSAHGPGATIIDGSCIPDDDGCVLLSHTAAVLQGFTIQHGYEDSDGRARGVPRAR